MCTHPGVVTQLYHSDVSNTQVQSPKGGLLLQAQAQKQQEGHAQLKSYIDDEIRAVHERISAQIRDSQLGLKACVDSLGRNIQDLKDAMR